MDVTYYSFCLFCTSLTNALVKFTGAVRYLIRGAKAVRGANSRAKFLKDLATKKAKESHQFKDPVEDTTKGSQQNKGLSLLKLGLLRRKHLAVKNTDEKGAPLSSKPSLITGLFRPLDLENKPPYSGLIPASFEDEKSIKGLSIRQVLERVEFHNGL